MEWNVYSHQQNQRNTPTANFVVQSGKNNCSEDVMREEDECWQETNNIHRKSVVSFINSYPMINFKQIDHLAIMKLAYCHI